MTVTLVIGNSDDKLSQSQWCDFVRAIESAVDRYASRTHFYGAPPTTARWQNALWLFEIDDNKAAHMKNFVTELRADWGQDSVAWIEGVPQFI